MCSPGKKRGAGEGLDDATPRKKARGEETASPPGSGKKKGRYMPIRSPAKGQPSNPKPKSEKNKLKALVKEVIVPKQTVYNVPDGSE